MYTLAKTVALIGLISFVFFKESLGNPLSKIDSKLLVNYKSKATLNILIHMKDGNLAPLEQARAASYLSRGDRLTAGAKLLQHHAEESQYAVKLFLQENGVGFKSFWISNQIYIPGAPLSLVRKLAALDQVSEIYEEPIVLLESKRSGIIIEESNSPRDVQWGVSKIQADLVWNITGGTTGEGVVVGSIDTGVRGTHQDLQGNFRSSYGWRDPATESELPFDDNGHGTHVMGILVGANGIGVAPGAEWVACKGCGAVSCLSSHLIECGQFMLCPTLPDGSSPNCTIAPSVVSNSWGGGSGNNFFDAVSDAWIALGITPVFALGNSGPGCSTGGSPADRNVLGVGTTQLDDTLSPSSARGPSASTGAIKPDITAPGQNIYSAFHTSDDAYTTMSGSSMSCPHTAGTAALILSARQLSYEDVKAFLFNGTDTEGLTPPNTNCGGISDSVYPNNAYGHGRINALNSVFAVIISSKK